jgi:hypothetical protein
VVALGGGDARPGRGSSALAPQPDATHPVQLNVDHGEEDHGPDDQHGHSFAAIGRAAGISREYARRLYTGR